MDFGVAYFPAYDAARPGAVARLVQEHGQESLFFPDHTHIPAARQTPFPDGGELPRKYSRTYELFVALTAAAESTSSLRVGSGICLVVERDPIVTAKQVASVDHLSGGRLEFGVGAGWNREEMRNHGTDPRTRMRLMAERIEAMKAIWTESEASYHGEFVEFEHIWSWPKPAQRPHPPILVGGDGPTVLDRVLAFGDAWFPDFVPDLDNIVERARSLWDRASRPIDLMMMGVPSDPAVFERLERAGCRRVVHWLPSSSLPRVEQELEKWGSAIADLAGDG